MRYILAKPTRRLIWKIQTVALIISIVVVFGSTSVFARGGGHDGGHGDGHRGHHGGHAGSRLGGFTAGSIARGHFTNQNPCIATDKTLADCPQLGEKQWQMIPTDKAPRFESRFE